MQQARMRNTLSFINNLTLPFGVAYIFKFACKVVIEIKNKVLKVINYCNVKVKMEKPTKQK